MGCSCHFDGNYAEHGWFLRGPLLVSNLRPFLVHLSVLTIFTVLGLLNPAFSQVWCTIYQCGTREMSDSIASPYSLVAPPWQVLLEESLHMESDTCGVLEDTLDGVGYSFW
jgi:hypothetical protein